jgi:hypothetical protein
MRGKCSRNLELKERRIPNHRLMVWLPKAASKPFFLGNALCGHSCAAKQRRGFDVEKASVSSGFLLGKAP